MLWQEEKYNEIGNTVVNTTEKWTDSSLKEIQDSIKKEKDNLNDYKQMYESTGNEISQQQQQQAQQNLQNLANELEKRTTTVETLGEEEKNAWRILATESYDIYAEKIRNMEPEMAKKIQKATGVIVEETPYAKQATNYYIEAVIESLDKDEQFRKEAVDSLNSYLSGLSDEEKKELLRQAGIQDADKVAEGLKEGKRLSEEQGVEMLKGLKTGLQNNSSISALVIQAHNIASKIMRGLSIDVSSIINKSFSNVAPATSLQGFADGLDYVPYDNFVARLHKGERVLTAKENEEYNKAFGVQGILSARVNRSIMNNQTNNNRNIVVQFYPQQMTNSEMEKAFNYIDKRYGQYMS